MNEKPGATNKKEFRKPVRLFENSGTVNPEESYYVQLENVANTRGQDIQPMVDRGRYFSGLPRDRAEKPLSSNKPLLIEKR